MGLAESYRFLRTIRHVPAAKLWHRARLRLTRRFYQQPSSPQAWLSADALKALVEFSATYRQLPHLQADPVLLIQQREHLLTRREGWLLNRSFSLPTSREELQTLLAEHSALWKENYGYLSFLLPLADNPSPEAATLLEEQLELWWQLPTADRNWSTYGVARRLMTYTVLLAVAPQLSSTTQTRLCQALYQCARHVRSFLELDVGGNHLIKNLHSLLLATCLTEVVLPDDPWAQDTWDWLSKTLVPYFSEQVLSDGLHFERTPMYHAWVLQDLLEMLALLQAFKPEFNRTPLETLASRMLSALDALTLPSGKLPQYGDSLEKNTPSPKALHALAADVLPSKTASPAPPILDLPEGGFTIFRQGEAALVIKSGPLAPRSLPAHLHGDLGSIECHIGDQAVLVDSGTDDYLAGLTRDYFRNTGAHNTVWVPGAEQAELYGSFRLAEYPQFMGREFEQDASGAKLTLAYENHSGHYGHRRMVYDIQGRFWVVQDWITHLNPTDRPCYSLLHVHPDVDVRYENEQFTLGDRLLIVPFGVQNLEWNRHLPWRENLNLYSDGFQQARPGQLIAMMPRLFDCFGWVLVPALSEKPVCQKHGEAVEVRFPDGAAYMLSWDASGLQVAAHAPTP